MKSNNSFAPESIHSAYPIIKETVPKSERGYNTNNKYSSFPPLMSDGRNFATWIPACKVNENIQKSSFYDGKIF